MTTLATAVQYPLTLVSVTTGPTSRLLVDLSTLKSELGISGSSQDAKLTRIIRALSDGVTGPEGLDRTPWRAIYDMQIAARDDLWLRLPRWPIETVTSVTLDGTTVAASEYEVWGDDRSYLFAENNWTDTSGEPDYRLVATCGWVMPPDIEDWTAGAAYGAVGQKHFVRASNPSVTLLFEATTAGTAHASIQPAWPTSVGSTVVDNDITWTARAAYETPRDLAEAALVAALDIYRGGLNAPSGVTSERIGPWSATYREAGRRVLPTVLARACEGYR